MMTGSFTDFTSPLKIYRVEQLARLKTTIKTYSSKKPQ